MTTCVSTVEAYISINQLRFNSNQFELEPRTHGLSQWQEGRQVETEVFSCVFAMAAIHVYGRAIVAPSERMPNSLFFGFVLLSFPRGAFVQIQSDRHMTSARALRSEWDEQKPLCGCTHKMNLQ